jgi:hypothetical protein
MDARTHDGDLAIFCRQVRARSQELQEAMPLVADRGWTSIAVGMLRQELDSMVRVMFLLAQSDRGLRARLMAASVAGERWTLPTPKGNSDFVTDGYMVGIADRYTGWTRRVYRFGCSFIHLSNVHDYLARDPFQALPRDEREVITGQLNHYHGAELSPNSSFGEVARFVPKVLGKISTNLEYNLKTLEEDGDLNS